VSYVESSEGNRHRSIVVLGMGNMLMKDDGIGVWVVRGLADAYDWPAQVRFVDGGVAGLRCLSEFENADGLLIIDAVLGRETPGTVYRLKPEDVNARGSSRPSAHEVGVFELISVAKAIGKLPPTRILGIQPGDAHEFGAELTPVLRDALPRVIEAVIEELRFWEIEPVRREASDA